MLLPQEWVGRVGSSDCAFMNRLSDIIKEELSVWDERGSLDDLISLAVWLDNKLSVWHLMGQNMEGDLVS